MKFSEKFIKANDNICDFDNHVNAPYFRKEITLDFEPDTAEITICGLGFYELYINGEDITKGPLAPYISNPDHICYYDNYNLKGKLKKGKNVIGILLGNGFRNAFGGLVWDFEKNKSRGPVITAFCVEAENADNKICIEADETVKTAPSPITFNDLRMGCRYDARLETDNWNKVNYDDTNWENAIIAEKPAGDYKLCEAEPIVVTDKLKPVSINFYEELPYVYESTSQSAKPRESSIRKNVYVFDFGFNLSGVTALKINGKKGQKITIRHTDFLIRGNFSINTNIFYINNRQIINKYIEYGQADEYICKGGEEIFIPKFKYDGFRYAYVEGLEKDQVTEDTLTFYVTNSDIKRRGDFSCSCELLNKLQKCSDASDLSNFHYFPTDCPQREKNGWTGDVSTSAEHLLLKFKASKSLCEWLNNIQKAQKPSGILPGIVPTGEWGYSWGNGPAYDSVCVNLPYNIYRFDGDKSVILENTPMILRYFNYIVSIRNDRGLIDIGLGDYTDPYEAENGYISSPVEVTSTLQVIDMAKKAAHLFKETNQLYAKDFAERIAQDFKETFRNNLIDFSTMTVAGNCQTSQALAIAVGIFNHDEKEMAFKKLLELIHEKDDTHACGFQGLRVIFHLLVDNNEQDLAYKMITSTKRTGYGNMLKNGATTLHEDFCDTDEIAGSQNHHWCGDISSLTFQKFTGLKPNPNVNDISHFEISPSIVTDLNYCECYYDSKFGRINVKWERKDKDIVLSVSAPDGIHGTIIAPKGYTMTYGEMCAIEKGDKEYVFIKRN